MPGTIAVATRPVNSARFGSIGYSLTMQPKDIRLQKLRELLKEHGDNKASLARTLGKAPAQISQWFNGVRTITEESARQMVMVQFEAENVTIRGGLPK